MNHSFWTKLGNSGHSGTQKLFLLPNARKRKSTQLDEEVIDQNEPEHISFSSVFFFTKVYIKLQTRNAPNLIDSFMLLITLFDVEQELT